MRHFAIIPACGQSVRMGRPKLLLPLAGRPLILHTVAAWQQAGMSATVVVVRAENLELAAALQPTGVELVMPPSPPPDMKASVQAALRYLQTAYRPAAEDAFLVAPADMPQLSPAIIRALVTEHSGAPASILVPTLAGHRGHPVLYPWPLAEDVFALGSEEGLSALAQRKPVGEVPCDGLVAANNQPFADIDTPDQYRAAGGEYRSGPE